MGYNVAYDFTVDNFPRIYKDGGTGSWRDAKKELRKWYLEQAKSLREISEKDYFKNE